MKNLNKKELFILDELGSEITGSLDFIENISEVEKVICLPDISLKEKYKNLGYKIDFPSSCAIVASDEVLYPQLNARGINCGMSLIKIGIDYNDVDLERIEKIVLKINKGLFYNIFYKFHLPLVDKYNINKEEMFEISNEGINYLIKKFKLKSEIIDKFEDKGSCLLNYAMAENEFIDKKWLNGPKSLIKKFGRNFAGNHFFELQKVNRIFDNNLANKYNIKEDGLYIMYHTAGLGLEAIANNGFINKYIKKNELVGIKGKKMREKVNDLYSILMNFGYAYRLATYIIIKDAIEEEFKEAKVRLITDVPHNTVRLKDKKYFYRRNSIELFSDKPSIVTGSYKTDSFLVGPGSSCDKSFKSADHGSGEVLDRLFSKLDFNKGSDKKIKKYKLKKGVNSFFTIKKEKIDYEDVKNQVIDYLSEEKIINPIVSFSPIMNLKYN